MLSISACAVHVINLWDFGSKLYLNSKQLCVKGKLWQMRVHSFGVILRRGNLGNTSGTFTSNTYHAMPNPLAEMPEIFMRVVISHVGWSANICLEYANKHTFYEISWLTTNPLSDKTGIAHWTSLYSATGTTASLDYAYGGWPTSNWCLASPRTNCLSCANAFRLNN